MKINIKRKIEAHISSKKIVDYLLADRNIKNKKEFLNPLHPAEIKFSSLFPSQNNALKKTFNLLKKLLKEKKMLVVYADYDADGLTGGAILWETLHLLGFNVMPHVPDRKKEGYGFSKKGIDIVKKKYNPALIISVDHGIVAHEQISYARKIGIPVIVTDHHQKTNNPLKDAFAVFHTDKLSGSGVSYFFSREIYYHFKSLDTKYKTLQPHFNSDFLALSAIGTVADLVPLVGASRSIVKYGLQEIGKSKRAGLRHILKDARIERRPISTYEVGFMIAPRLNAFGRIGNAIDSLRLLCTANQKRARLLAQKAGHTNKMRQDMVEQSFQEAKKKVSIKENIIVVFSDHWHEGIIGLIASKLTETFSRPSIVMTRSDGFYKGSARSIPGFDITEFLRSQKQFLVDVGGHKAAAGFTIESSKINDFILASQKKAKNIINDKDLIPTLEVDMGLPLSSMSLKLVMELKKLEPFGIGNPTPLFLSRGSIHGICAVGVGGKHLRLHISDKSGYSLPIIYFNGGEDFFLLKNGQNVQVVFHLEENEWRGQRRLQGRAKAIQSFDA